ncbi:DNA integrity scanning protein DisA [Caloramator mitchellensis]|uniref:DNA integrity scanning protein DisA n=1 Tax=Caloramator mitchellensis TaxID=908809 RepID=A0A0R3JYP2_CALMK|nr:DNA integrity scanning diadenylate cyclase DisA [Caloramator mitchellensis]KRQ86076.1 DNA integrity scanning protein DisA [Caloramator mitchellensis]
MRDTKEVELLNVLRLVAPGTPLREGLENILKAKTGGLIVVGNEEQINKLLDGGFFINSEYSPAYLYELAKMDGAIVLSDDLKRILYANTQIIPDSSIPTLETGTRHRTADRFAKQTGNIAIAISQRRNLITVFKGNIKYVLKDTSMILTKANQAIQTLERYKSVLDEAVTNLSALEFEDLVTIYDVVTAIQRSEMVMRIVNDIERYVIELGNEGRLISLQLNDLVSSVEEDEIRLIRDFVIDGKDFNEVYKSIKGLSSEELLELSIICKLLGYNPDLMLDTMVSSRGYRILNKIPKLPQIVIENMIKTLGDFKRILLANIEELDEVEGIGEARARSIKEWLKKLQEQVLLNRRI